MTPHTPVGRPLRPQGKLLQEDARRHHRSLLLQQLFREGPASRADLARTTGLTRVTVSDLVGDDAESHLAVRLRAVETDIEQHPLIEDAVLTLSLPDRPSLLP